KATTFLPEFSTWMTLDNAWGQRYAVTTFCRILHTLQTGRVTSKKASLEWARDNLDSEWSALVQQVIDDRAQFSSQASRPGTAQQTVEFAEYAKRQAEIGLTHGDWSP
ncbi:MAG: aminoglycoside adenylyltransferase domain-containing protein, partial [Candidatus Dormibacteria bacterium]